MGRNPRCQLSGKVLGNQPCGLPKLGAFQKVSNDPWIHSLGVQISSRLRRQSQFGNIIVGLIRHIHNPQQEICGYMKFSGNPDMDTSRSQLNFHLVKPHRSYQAEAERQIAQAGCRTRKDSVRVVEALITASPEFFQYKSSQEVQAFFRLVLDFIKSKQSPETILSAVVHVDEKTPHMHLSFVPITPDERLSAKDILGNRKNLIKWQDDFWKFMVKKYPDLERGESASETGRTHIPPRLFIT